MTATATKWIVAPVHHQCAGCDAAAALAVEYATAADAATWFAQTYGNCGARVEREHSRRQFPRVHDIGVVVLNDRVMLNDNDRNALTTLVFPSAVAAEEYADLYRGLLHAIDRQAAEA